MGADFIFAIATTPYYEDNTPVRSTEWEDIEPQIRQRIQEMRDRDGFDYIADLEYVYQDWYEELTTTASGDELNDACAAHLLNDAEEYFQWTFSRQVGELDYNGKRTIITGGLSHGDDPTDCFRIVNFIGQIGLFDEPFKRALDQKAIFNEP